MYNIFALTCLATPAILGAVVTNVLCDPALTVVLNNWVNIGSVDGMAMFLEMAGGLWSVLSQPCPWPPGSFNKQQNLTTTGVHDQV